MLAVPSTWQCCFKSKEPLGHLHYSDVPPSLWGFCMDQLPVSEAFATLWKTVSNAHLMPWKGAGGAWNIVIYCKLGLFRLMSCSPGVLSPGLRVVLPGVWSCFAQIESPHLYLCLWMPFLERGIFTHLFGLFISVILIITSIRWISWTCRDSIYSENQ